MVSDDERLAEVVPFQTADGSFTLYDEDRGVHYRSHHGAVTESRHVFLGATGLLGRLGTWVVGELGFGAAVNLRETVAAFRRAPEAERLEYHTVDWRPVTPEHLEFHEGEGGELARRAADEALSLERGVVRAESDDGAIAVVLHVGPWQEAALKGLGAKAFFFDPFARDVNPEAWTAAAFRWAKGALSAGGRLATYSAATAVKRAMFEAGLVVATAPGPGRKREITVAALSAEALQGLKLLRREKYVGGDA